MSVIPTPGMWMHVKSGQLYRILCFANMEATGEQVVVYVSVAAGTEIWVRPTTQFYEKFKRVKHEVSVIDANSVPQSKPEAEDINKLPYVNYQPKAKIEELPRVTNVWEQELQNFRTNMKFLSEAYPGINKEAIFFRYISLLCETIEKILERLVIRS